MKNKILMLPISGETGDVSTINQCQGSMETLMDTAIKQFQNGMEMLMDAANNLPEDLLLDSGVSGASAENWERYKQIVRGIFAADDAGWRLLKIQYQQEPSIVKDCASVTITLSNDRITDNYGAMALSLASLLADKITTSVDEDGNVQICFTVGSIRAASSSED